MRILVFSPYYPPHIGGLESHSDEFNRHMAAREVQVVVLTPRLPVSAPETEVRYGRVEILRFPAIELIHNYPVPKFWSTRFWRMWETLSRDNFDFVISRTRFFFTSLMAWRFSRKVRAPWIHIEHGSDFAHFNGRVKTMLGQTYDRIFGSFVLRSCHAVVANSEASRAFVRVLSRRTDCRVIYRGVDVDRIAAATPNDVLRRYWPGHIIIGYVGRLIDGKGVHDLLKSFSLLNSPDASLVIVGDGPERHRLEQLSAQLAIAERVRFMGHLLPAQALSSMAAFDIVVNPSYTEGLPSSIIEAALLRKAIVATDVGGTREIISGTGDGYLVAPGDHVAMAEKLALLNSDPDLRYRLGEAAFMKAQRRFDWDAAIGQYVAEFAAFHGAAI
ncbi:MAG TPA: glycosyltransferase family 4 protein [Burkholderiales bacterium]|nr:glycosyltransferase family 4 protein [Burkholderiales bacterium]